MDGAAVEQWIERYEQCWRSAGTDHLSELFTPDATYLASPWARPVEGLTAIRSFWDDERDGPDEGFTMSSEVVAVEGTTAVVRVSVEYDHGGRWRDLWVVEFAADGRCSSFEEWPFAPDQPDGHGERPASQSG